MNYRESFKTLTQAVAPARLMAVSKYHSLEEVMAAYDAGFRLFGENHVQEIVAKFSEDRPEDLELHMIGHLQSNKVNKVVPLVDMIESVDSLPLLKKIDKAAANCSKVMDVLLEFNTSGESAKSGFDSEEDLFECVRQSKDVSNIRLRGLMTVGPVDCDPGEKDELTQKAFDRLRELFFLCRTMACSECFDVLSMGMSGDYALAVDRGSTEVRIGTAIFGERNYDR